MMERFWWVECVGGHVLRIQSREKHVTLAKGHMCAHVRMCVMHRDVRWEVTPMRLHLPAPPFG